MPCISFFHLYLLFYRNGNIHTHVQSMAVVPSYSGGAMTKQILIIDDEAEVGESLVKLFASEGLESLAITNPSTACSLLSDEPDIRLIILDVRMPEIDGITLLQKIKTEFTDRAVIMIYDYASLPKAVRAMKFGAANFFAKPLDFDKLLTEAKTLLQSAASPVLPDQRFITNDPAMLALKRQIATVAATPAPVIITGESGTGKELVAEQLHLLSARRDKPLVKINCAAIPEALLESELFGHEKGAFTGAQTKRVGKFEKGDGGTMFLDEIGDMTLATQAKVLRAIQEQEFDPVGSDRGKKVDLRFVAATNRDLQKMIQDGSFREDLYYRLSVVILHLLPLRERPGDIPLLVDHFINVFSAQYGKSIRGIEPNVLAQLTNHSWPGNIRELRNCVQRAVIFCDSDTIQFEHLPGQYAHITDAGIIDDYKEAMDSHGKEIIIQALERTSGVKWKTAKELHIHRKTLYNRMKKYGIDG